jgi:hypothetical protein
MKGGENSSINDQVKSGIIMNGHGENIVNK